MLSYESPLYWKVLHESVNKTKGNFEVDYFIGLDRASKKEKELHKYVSNLTTVDVTINPPKRKETTHEKRIRIGELFNKLFSKMPRNYKYAVLTDGDIAFVKKNWYELLIKELTDQYIIIGQEYADRWPEKYQNFPMANMFVFDVEKFLSLNVDFRGKGSPLYIETNEQSNIFGRPKGSKLNRDIGWRIPESVKMAGYDGKPMKLVPGNSKKAKILLPHSDKDHKIYKMNKKDNIKGLFEIHWKNEPYALHLTKSTCLEFDKHPICRYWLRRVEKCMKIL